MRNTFKRNLMATLLATALLAGCAQDAGNKEVGGTVLGGLGGALLGAQFGSGTGQLMATAAGTMLGAYLGNQVGSGLDKADQNYVGRAESNAYSAPIGQTITWSNPQSGNSGTITPVREGRSQSGSYCREFQQTVSIGGKNQKAFGRACQQPDGSWQIVE